MRKFREMADRRQLALLPVSVEEYVPSEDIVRYVDALVDEFDLSPIERKYSYQGRPAYSPRVLVKILVYGKLRGISACRELAQATKENMRFIFLANNERPDFRTLSDFRKNHHQELAGLLTQTIAIGVREKLITLEFVAVDGTKLQAFAGRKSFKTPEHLQRELARLEAEISESLKQDIAREEESDKEHGDSDGESRLPKELQDKKTLREKLRRALDQYQAIEGEKPKSISLTDPQCRYMRQKGINPSYNAQLAVDGKHLMAVGGYTTTACCDSSELEPLVEDIEQNTGNVPKKLAADRGYTRRQALKTLEDKNIEGYVALCDYRKLQPQNSFRYRPERDDYLCRKRRVLSFAFLDKKTQIKRYSRRDCSACQYRSECTPRGAANKGRSINVSIFEDSLNRMQERLLTPLAAEMKKLRSATVEPVFGVIKHAMRFRQVTVRGNAKVNSIWKFQLAAYNIAKLARYFQIQQPLPTSG